MEKLNEADKSKGWVGRHFINEIWRWAGGDCSSYTVKKVHEFPVSSRYVINQTPPGQE